MTRRIITSTDLEAVAPGRPGSARPDPAPAVSSTSLPAIGGPVAPVLPQDDPARPIGTPLPSPEADGDDTPEPTVTLRSMQAVPSSARRDLTPPRPPLAAARRAAESSTTLRAVPSPPSSTRRPADEFDAFGPPPRPSAAVAPAGEATRPRFERLPASVLSAPIVDQARRQQHRGQLQTRRGQTALVASLVAIVAGGVGIFLGQSTRDDEQQVQTRIRVAVEAALAEERVSSQRRIDAAVEQALRRANRNP